MYYHFTFLFYYLVDCSIFLLSTMIDVHHLPSCTQSGHSHLTFLSPSSPSPVSARTFLSLSQYVSLSPPLPFAIVYTQRQVLSHRPKHCTISNESKAITGASSFFLSLPEYFLSSSSLSSFFCSSLSLSLSFHRYRT